MTAEKQKILLTALGFCASVSVDAGLTPWSVYVTMNGQPVVGGGGTYPDANPDSKLLILGLSMQDACILAENLREVFEGLGYECQVELLADG